MASQVWINGSTLYLKPVMLVNEKKLDAITPSLLRLGACILYELLTVIAILFTSAALFVLVAGDASTGIKRLLLQIFLWLVTGGYFIRCWLKSGQTLAMQAWKIKLVDSRGDTLSLKSAIYRYLLTTLSLAFGGIGFLWAVTNKQHRFMHDKLLNSRMVMKD